MNKPRIFIHVEDGIIQTILADTPMDIMVLDGDVEGMNEDSIKTYTDPFLKETFKAREAWGSKVTVQKRVVHSYFKQR